MEFCCVLQLTPADIDAIQMWAIRKIFGQILQDRTPATADIENTLDFLVAALFKASQFQLPFEVTNTRFIKCDRLRRAWVIIDTELEP